MCREPQSGYSEISWDRHDDVLAYSEFGEADARRVILRRAGPLRVCRAVVWSMSGFPDPSRWPGIRTWSGGRSAGGVVNPGVR